MPAHPVHHISSETKSDDGNENAMSFGEESNNGDSGLESPGCSLNLRVPSINEHGDALRSEFS